MKRHKRRDSFWPAFLRGLREGADDQEDDDGDEGYSFFKFAPGPPFSSGEHPRHAKGMFSFFRRRGRR